jgi:hypothetical protein
VGAVLGGAAKKNLCEGIIASDYRFVFCTQLAIDECGVAAKEKITFCDASYVHVAAGQGLTLVTEDSRIRKVAAKYAKTTTTQYLQANSY